MKSLYYRITGTGTAFVLRWHKYIAAALLALMFGLAFTAMSDNSAIVDEVAHIPAGYSYLHYGDYRLNPEHPPLMKDLAALPLQFMNLKFPINQPAWTTEVNGEWDAGWAFLYNLGNNADAILFWARLPILIVAIVFGGWFYWALRKRWGIAVGLMSLFFYCLSPNFLGHAALVTTDLGASVFMFLAIITFGRFASSPTKKNMLLLSLAIATAELAKFSSALLYPFLGMICLFLAWLIKDRHSVGERMKLYVGRFLGASGLSVLWIWLFYTPHVWNMPTYIQDNLIVGSLTSPNDLTIAKVLVWFSHVQLAGIYFMKPIVQYFLGLVMDTGRVEGGNVTYFNGAVTDQSFRWYFPEMFALKTQVAFLILMIVSIWFLWWSLKRPKGRKFWNRVGDSFRKYTLEWTLGTFSLFYFAVSIAGNLDLGIRHILPVYLPIFVLVAISTVKIMRKLVKTKWNKLASAVLILLLGWYGMSTIAAHPYYISYFNELIGGGANAENYFTDSGVDWGQDFKRLVQYVDSHPKINHIAVDYFGGALPEYYFCQRAFNAQGQLITDGTYDCSHSKFEQWHSSYGRYPGQYIAVSETYLENDRYFAAQSNQPGYGYLRAMKPIAKIGNTIYIYKLY
ncbi:MAG TPA: hypothetical protein VMS08_04555 [Candidatus Saccharimonadia bacterium]|nr:hypothetical protein [Candidatus Saccharimonadia bacterium]